MRAEYGICGVCGGEVYRSKATGRNWWHVDYRQDKIHRGTPGNLDKGGSGETSSRGAVAPQLRGKGVAMPPASPSYYL